MVENGIELEQILVKKAEEDEDFAAVLEEYVIIQQKMLKMRKYLKR